MSTGDIDALMNRPLTFFQVEPYRMMAVEEKFEAWVNQAITHVEQGGSALEAFEARMSAQMAATARASVARALGIGAPEVKKNLRYKVIHKDIIDTLRDVFTRATQSQLTHTPTESEAAVLSFGLDPEYIRWAKGRPRRRL